MKRFLLPSLGFFLFLVAIGIPATLFGQNKSPVKRNAITHQLSGSLINWLSPSLDTALLIRVQRLTVSSKSSDSEISIMFDQMKREATTLQCNGFLLEEYLPSDKNGNAFMTFSLFKISDSLLQVNEALKERGQLYILGSQRDADEFVKFRINGEKNLVRKGLLKRVEQIPGKEYAISKGGLFGMTIYLRPHSDAVSKVISLGGMSVGNNGMQPAQIGVSISTGSLSTLDSELGLLLIQVLKKE